MTEPFFHKQPTLSEVKLDREIPTTIPSEIGPYKIDSLLNKGGMSLLYMGIHPKTRDVLAIKVLSPAYAKNPDMVQRFLKESKIISMANHPHIVKLYGEGQWEGGLYIAMEFIRGVSLRQFIEQHSLSMKRCLKIILDTAYALAHLHSHGVIHGDLKPENILITEKGEVKVIDFGIASLQKDLKKEKKKSIKILGTPAYLSPEQKEDPCAVSFASDIYALGIITYELLSGALSFGVIHLSQVPKGFRPILERALAVSIEERYKDIIDFIADVSDYFKSGGLDKDRPSTDQFKEILESLQITAQSLSMVNVPNWPEVEIGIARYQILNQSGSYIDCFQLRNQTYVFCIAESSYEGLSCAIYISSLRGMIRTLISDPHLSSSAQFISRLHQLVYEDTLQQKFAVCFLVLSPLRHELAFLSCGLGQLIHLTPEYKTPRVLSNHNLPLGIKQYQDFETTIDNWNIGDHIVLHSFELASPSLIQEGLVENISLSPQIQADALLKKISHQRVLHKEKNPKILLTIHRVG